MSKTTLIVTIIIIISLVFGGLFGFYFYINKHSPVGGNNITSTNGGFSNFGNTNSSTSTPQPQGPSEIATTTPVVTSTIPKPIPMLRHLTLAPVAGFSFINKDLFSTTTIIIASSTKKTAPAIIGSVEVFRWIDRATGNIFETSSSTLATSRITNTTIPRVYEASFIDSKGTSVLLRGLLDGTDIITTQYGVLQPLDATSTQQIIKLTDLQSNISAYSVSPSGTQLFSIIPGNNRGVLSNPDGKSQVSIFSSPFHEWLTSWPTSQSIVLTTKPSAITEGFSYILDSKSKAITKLVGNKNGMTVLMSPDSTKALVGESPQGSLRLELLTRKDNIVRDLFVRTLPEKCIWSKKDTAIIYCAVPQNIVYANYPDVWYQGIVWFSDDLWKIDTTTGFSERIMQPTSLEEVPLDMINLTLSKNEDYIMFENKSDLSLWSYLLENPKTVAPQAPVVSTSTINRLPITRTSTSTLITKPIGTSTRPSDR